MRTNCSTDDYAALYAPWLTSAPAFASRFVEARDRVLDLCGGTGAVAKAADEMGCRSINLVDVNPRAVPPLGRVRVMKGDAHTLSKYYGIHAFDTIVCRQAVGYLNLDKIAASAAQVLAPGGSFCFNNFRRPKWFRKKYEFEGDTYTELGWYIGRTVWHIQRRHGRGWDLTKFRWHTHGDIVAALSKKFNVHVERTEKTNYYRCVIQDFA